MEPESHFQVPILNLPGVFNSRLDFLSQNAPNLESSRTFWPAVGSFQVVGPQGCAPKVSWLRCTVDAVYKTTLFFFAILHPWQSTWNLKIPQLKRKFIFQTSMFGLHVKFPWFKCKSISMTNISVTAPWFTSQPSQPQQQSHPSSMFPLNWQEYHHPNIYIYLFMYI